MKVLRGLVASAALGLGGVAAWELQRRRDLRAVRADPHWDELNESPHGRVTRVRSDDGTELHVEVHGDDAAPPVVLVHGWMESLELWQLVVRRLAASHRVIVYDQRGHGRSAVPEGLTPYTAECLAEDFDVVLRACLRPGERAVVAGHSMGAMTVFAWAALHRNEVTERLVGAVLVNTATHELVTQALVLGPLAGARLRAAVLPRTMWLYRPLTTQLEPVGYRVVRRVVGGRDTSPAQIAFYHRMFLSCPVPVATAFGRMFTTLDLRESIPALTVPSVVVAGGDDRLLPPVHAQRLAEALPAAAGYAELERIGHMAPVEATDAIVDALREVTPTAAAGPARARRRTRRPKRQQAAATS